MSTFAITRADGRTNAQVIIDAVRDGAAGTIFTYRALGEALEHGTDKAYATRDVQGAVRQAASRLLKEQQRRLINVKGVGYRIAEARQHMSLALTDKRRASVQFARGLNTLRNVRWEELDANTRQVHEGHLMLTEALYASQSGFEKRLRKVEDAIARATGRG